MKTIATEQAPKALGPYSQAIESNGLVYCSGQIPINPASGDIDAKDIAGQTRQAVQNLSAVLEEAGTSLAKVVKTTVFMADLDDFAVMNAVYAQLFGDNKPARACVQIARLPKDAKVEIEAIAEK